MKSTIGKNITISLYGESHGESIGVVIDGLEAGISLDLEAIQTQLDKRRAKGKISTQRHEEDLFHITSGFFNGKTTGTPLHIQIMNKEQQSRDYTPQLLRPSHADYTAYMKYHGCQDYRGGGHFSGRITAPLVAAGAVAQQILQKKGIVIGTHIKQCMNIHDREFNDYAEDIRQLEGMDFAVLDSEAQTTMIKFIEETAVQKDSVGGILETVVLNVPVGIGEPYFHSIESNLSAYLFSVPAVKGVEFGMGFDFVNHYGSEANDPWMMDKDKIIAKTNNNGGINGGIANGMPILFRTVIKPTPSIFKAQNTVDFNEKKDTIMELQGRHDPAIFHRARVVIDAATALCLLDLCVEAHGGKWMRE